MLQRSLRFILNFKIIFYVDFFHTFFIGFDPIQKINIFVVTWD